MNYKCSLTQIVLKLLTSNEKTVLTSLSNLEGLSISSVSRNLFKNQKIPTSTAKHIIKKFKEIGIIEETNGGSHKLISLTKQGKILSRLAGG